MDEQRAGLRAVLESVPSELHDRRPAGDGWSITQIVEHLAVVEAAIAGMLKKRLEEARAAGLGPETEAGSVLADTDVTAMVDRTVRRVAGEASQPRAGLDMAAALAALGQSRAALLKVVQEADGLALGRISAPHPARGLLNGYQWLVFVGAHETRHTQQIRETAAALAGGPL